MVFIGWHSYDATSLAAKMVDLHLDIVCISEGVCLCGTPAQCKTKYKLLSIIHAGTSTD